MRSVCATPTRGPRRGAPNQTHEGRIQGGRDKTAIGYVEMHPKGHPLPPVVVEDRREFSGVGGVEVEAQLRA